MWKNKFILASQSPRRKELLQLLDIEFSVQKSDIEEVVEEGVPFEQVVMDLAVQKAIHIARENRDSTVLGFDTLVILNNQALGKPQDRDDAYRMLRLLSGKTHTVLTGCAVVCCDEIHTLYDHADVTFATMTDKEINEYLDTEEPFDKAGSYGIQGYGAKYITGIKGDYYSVMGVPLHKLYKLLRGK